MTTRPNNERPESSLILLFKWAKYKQQKDIPEFELLTNIPRGFKAGVPNVFWAYPKRNYHGLFILLMYKEGVNEVYYSQKNWLGSLSKYGYKTAIAKDHREAKNILLDYYNNKL